MDLQPPNILIIGHANDPHVIAVADAVARSGGRTVIFDRYSQGHFITMRVDRDGPSGSVTTPTGQMSLSSFSSVWWRLKPLSVREIGGVYQDAAEEFGAREWRLTLSSLEAFTPQAIWVNPVHAQARANLKPYQLAAAVRHGFSIPATLYSNSPEDVQRMLHERGSVVYKTIGPCMLPPDRVIYTSEVDARLLAENWDSVQVAPGTWQQQIPKSVELRITIVGTDVFAAEIDSQSRDVARVDWRQAQFDDIFRPTQIDNALRDRLLGFQDSLGLTMGAYDLILTPSGEQVFLEVNPSGQWLWLEHRLGFPISDSVAALLLRASDCTFPCPTKMQAVGQPS